VVKSFVYDVFGMGVGVRAPVDRQLVKIHVCMHFLRGPQNRVWFNRRWHRRTAEGKLVVESAKARVGARAPRTEEKNGGGCEGNRSSSASHSREANRVRRNGREAQETEASRRNERPRHTRALVKASKFSQGASEGVKREARQSAPTAKHVAPALHALDQPRKWKMWNSDSQTGETEWLHQVCACVVVTGLHQVCAQQGPQQTLLPHAPLP
jgi:hypothetical protein